MPQNYAKIAKTTPFLVFLRRLKIRQKTGMVFGTAKTGPLLTPNFEKSILFGKF